MLLCLPPALTQLTWAEEELQSLLSNSAKLILFKASSVPQTPLRERIVSDSPMNLPGPAYCLVNRRYSEMVMERQVRCKWTREALFQLAICIISKFRIQNSSHFLVIDSVCQKFQHGTCRMDDLFLFHISWALAEKMGRFGVTWWLPCLYSHTSNVGRADSVMLCGTPTQGL